MARAVEDLVKEIRMRKAFFSLLGARRHVGRTIEFLETATWQLEQLGIRPVAVRLRQLIEELRRMHKALTEEARRLASEIGYPPPEGEKS